MIHFRVGRLAGQIGVHRNTVRQWIRTGELVAKPAVAKRYAIEKTVLVRFLSSRGVEPEAAVEIADNVAENFSPRGMTQTETHKRKKEVPMSDKTVGSVMVVGGGIAGIQASLDLAETGYFVYLLEKSPGIGGGMAQLDKTYPTNDCAM